MAKHRTLKYRLSKLLGIFLKDISLSASGYMYEHRGIFCSDKLHGKRFHTRLRDFVACFSLLITMYVFVAFKSVEPDIAI